MIQEQRLIKRKLLLVMACMSLATSLFSQEPTTLPSAPAFSLDADTYKTDGSIPYDRYFHLVLTNVHPQTASIQVRLLTGVLRGEGAEEFSTTSTAANVKSVAIPMFVKLKANNRYHFEIKCLDNAGAEKQSIFYGFTIKTKLGDFIKLDLGIGYAQRVNGIVAHTTTHFYLLPINNDLDLRDVEGRGSNKTQKILSSIGRNVFLRTSVFVGVSPVTLYTDEKPAITKSTPLGNLLFGVGIRSPFYGKHMPFNRNVGWVFLQPLRVNIGQMYYKQNSGYPQYIKDKDKLSFYVGLSYDVSIAGLLGPVGKLIRP